jgi:CDP-diacylglycerol--serine O-phosphatidyltransferase
MKKKAKQFLPNGFSLSNLLMGFISIIFTTKGEYYAAAVSVLAAMVLDCMDGRIARRFGVTSNMGKELDSLCDIVSFGVAPALLAYQTGLAAVGFWGLAAAALFPVCGAYRLASFNMQKQMPYFTGIPITAAGGTVVSLVISSKNLESFLCVVFLFALSFLMVSNIRYPNFKKINNPQLYKGFVIMGLLASIIISVKYTPGEVMFLVLTAYAASGVVMHIYSKTALRLEKEKA